MTDFQLWQIIHYTARLQEEIAKDNTAAIIFLRNELFNLKKAHQ